MTIAPCSEQNSGPDTIRRRASIGVDRFIENRDEIVGILASGRGYGAVAEAFGVSKKTAEIYCRRLGIGVRCVRKMRRKSLLRRGVLAASDALGVEAQEVGRGTQNGQQNDVNPLFSAHNFEVTDRSNSASTDMAGGTGESLSTGRLETKRATAEADPGVGVGPSSATPQSSAKSSRDALLAMLGRPQFDSIPSAVRTLP